MEFSFKGKFAILSFTIFLIAFGLWSDLSVQLPVIEANTLEDVEIHVSLGSLNEVGVFSLLAELEYNPDVLVIQNVVNDGCITQIWGTPYFNVVQPGILSVGLYGTDSITESGTLFTIIASVTAQQDTSSELTSMDFVFNEGEPQVQVTNGLINITHRLPELDSVNDLIFIEGDFIDFSITAQDPFNEQLFLDITNLPIGAFFQDFGNGSGQFQWQTDQTTAGEYLVTFTAENTSGFVDSAQMIISVQNDLTVWLPDIATTSIDTIFVPIFTDDITNLNVYSFYTRITFDDNVILPVELYSDSTLTENWGNVSYNINPNEIIISVFDTNVLSGAGKLTNIVFDIVGDEFTSSDLSFDFFMYNEEQPEVDLVDGLLFLGPPDPYFQVLEDIDIEEGDILDYTIVGHDPLNKDLEITIDSIPVGSVFIDNGDGIGDFHWDTTFMDGGSYLLEVTLTNENALTAIENWSINVQNTPQPPFVDNPINFLTFDEDTIDTSLELNIIFSDYDLNYGDFLDFSFTGNSQIDVTMDNGDVLLTPAEDWFGTEFITFIAIDQTIQSAQIIIEIEVTNVNDTPIVVAPIADLVFPEDISNSDINLNSVFYDVDGDPLLFSVSGNDFIQVQIADGLVTLTPNSNWFGSETLVFTASDQQDQIDRNRASISETSIITVTPVNDPPIVLNAIADIEMPQNTIYTTISMENVFYDIDSPLSFSVQNNSHINCMLNLDNTFELEPDIDWYGLETIYFTAEDDSGAVIFDIVQVKVTGTLLETEDFNLIGVSPAGWSTVHNGTTTFPWQIVNDSGNDYSYRVENTILRTSNERLLSPVYNLSTYTDVVVSFWHDFSPNTDCSASFQVSNNGFVWNTVSSFSSAETGLVSYQLQNFADEQQYVQFRWLYTSNSYSVSYWNLDDLQIEGVVNDSDPPTTITDLSAQIVDSFSVSLNWTVCSELYFSHYEVFISSDSFVTIEDEIWTDDPELENINTSTTLVDSLAFNAQYWFAIRGVDYFDNAAELSNIQSVILAEPPVCHSPFPTQSQQILQNNRTVEIGITFEDDFVIDTTTLAYRIDANGNGVYEENWNSVTGYSNGNSIAIRTNVTYDLDGDNLHFEFRGMDTLGSGFSYSGTNNQEGITDDYFVMIDATSPTELSDFSISSSSESSVELVWTSTTELHFTSYEIYYNSHSMIDTIDYKWDHLNDPALSNIASTTTQINGLDADSLYWFRIRAVDEAGNTSVLSEEIVSVPRDVLPVCITPFPVGQPDSDYANSQLVTIGCTFYDYFGIDESSVQYRIDENGNGLYDTEEGWHFVNSEITEKIRSRDNNDSLIVRVDALFSVDGDDLAFEFKANDIDGFGPVYSGENNLQGIEDDWCVNIDSQPPEDIAAVVVGNVGSTSLELLWLVSSDENFVGYEVYYNTHENITITDLLWDKSDDPNLAYPGSEFLSSIIENLQPSTTYYFRVRAVDIAGNSCPLSIEVSAQTEGEFPPKSPQNIQISNDYPSILLIWDPVTQNINNDSITVSSYHIYASEVPEFPATVDYHIATVTGTSFVHQNILQSLASKVFYKITAEQTQISSTQKSEIKPILIKLEN
jgi:Fibronectin type III domain/Bacterial Ig domain/Cohesin domain